MSKEDAYRLIRAFFESPEAGLRLLASEPHLVSTRTGLGETPLHYLAVENQIAAVKALAEHGAEVNTLNDCGGTPLSEAVSLGYLELVSELLSLGACIEMPGQDEPTIHGAVRSGSPEMVSTLLGAGANVDQQNSTGETALHLAAASDGLIAIVQVLLGAGARTDLRSFGDTAYEVAVSEGATKCASVLMPRD